jgi:hypothetical protein
VCSTFSSQDKESVYEVAKLVDKSNGYIFAGIEGDVKEFSKIAAGDTDWSYNKYPPVTAICFRSLLTEAAPRMVKKGPDHL